MLECRYENTEKRKAEVAKKGILYMGMGVSGGEEGARNGGPALYLFQFRHCLKIFKEQFNNPQ